MAEPLQVTPAGTEPAASTGPVFYFDVAVPASYLVAERILATMPVACEWIPVRAGDLVDGAPPLDPAAIEQRAGDLGLQAVVWPPAVPFDGELVQRAATYAKSIGRVVAFSLAAFRQAYAGGRDLSVADNVLIAGAACEMHPNAILKSVDTRGVRTALDAATALASERGVRTVPTIWTGTEVFPGEAGLDAAAAALSAPAR